MKKRGAWSSLYLVMRRYDEAGGKYLAASLSFFALLSFIPLLFSILNLFGYVISRIPAAKDAVTAALLSLFPVAGKMLTSEIKRIVTHSNVGWLSLGLFLWLGALVFGSLEHAMHVIFRSQERRHLLMRTGMKFIMVLIVGLLMVVSFWLACMPGIINSYPPLAERFPNFTFYVSGGMTMVSPIVLMIVALTGVYKYLPDIHVPTALAFRGGVAASLLWEAAKFIYATYINWVAEIGGLYGPLGVVIISLLWVYYSASIILIVAQALRMKLDGEIA